MDTTQYYAISLGFMLFILPFCGKLCANVLPKFAMKHFPLEQIRFPWGSINITWCDIFLMAIHCVGNVVFLAVESGTWADFSKRAGTLSLINAIPLPLGEKVTIIPKTMRLDMDKYAILHRYIGSVVLLEALAHVIAGTITPKPTFNTWISITGLLGGSILVTIVLSCVPFLFGHFYNSFALAHPLLGVAFYISVYLHTTSRPWTSNRIYVVISLAIVALNHASSLARITYRNFGLERGKIRLSSLAIVQRMVYEDTDRQARMHMPDALYLHIRPTRPWKLRGGQYVYLRFVDLDPVSFLQSHPFYIAWWYKNSEGDDVAVCVVEKRQGLTRKLSAIDNKTKKKVLIEGPYGRELRLDRYETILLFATGIGMTGLISMIAEIFKTPEYSPVMLRRVVLYWELDYLRHIAWASDFAKELLRQDIDKKLQIRVFVRGKYETNNFNLRDRVKVVCGEMPVETLVSSEIEGKDERILICFCTRDKLRSRIRNLAGRHGQNVQVEELEFRPRSLLDEAI